MGIAGETGSSGENATGDIRVPSGGVSVMCFSWLVHICPVPVNFRQEMRRDYCIHPSFSFARVNHSRSIEALNGKGAGHG